ncbi:hypothetical protein [Pseudomonas cyclaminis]|uniref:hypothetical protein n=1 Tax=Pseudomonas cyclaminis TaxID=2781239 RepID=UPI00382A34F5
MRLKKAEREQGRLKYGAHCGVLLCDRWHADHLAPVARELLSKQTTAGTWKLVSGKPLRPEHDVLENMMPACAPCNISKGDQTLEGWRSWIAGSVPIRKGEPMISLQALMEAFVEDHKESAAEERWEHPDIRFQPSDYGGLHIYFDKKPKDHSASSYSRSSERSEYMLDNAIHISFDRNGKDRDEKGREVGTVYSAKIDGEKISQTLRFRSPFEKMVAALYFGSSKIIVDCDEDEFSYGIYD